ncbi:hypothetical protein B0T25DRAFT_555116 [Lasiosphaeria hispida]|uniref:Uncharacterized protein n=1 Tax=Lasiosphaeria hispida TaxID=260671 RepID=A0AAJ0M992_9PEZI|nr:hypothetical protein B0T25DRAFT_555116 [Lasiosphaeria hispida]
MMALDACLFVSQEVPREERSDRCLCEHVKREPLQLNLDLGARGAQTNQPVTIFSCFRAGWRSTLNQLPLGQVFGVLSVRGGAFRNCAKLIARPKLTASTSNGSTRRHTQLARHTNCACSPCLHTTRLYLTNDRGRYPCRYGSACSHLSLSKKKPCRPLSLCRNTAGQVSSTEETYTRQIRIYLSSGVKSPGTHCSFCPVVQSHCGTTHGPTASVGAGNRAPDESFRDG